MRLLNTSRLLLVAIMALILTGCASSTGQQVIECPPIPKPPANLMQDPETLRPITKQGEPKPATAAEVVQSVTGNYSVFDDVRNQLLALQEWVRALE